jgi:hypothetical protein
VIAAIEFAKGIDTVAAEAYYQHGTLGAVAKDRAGSDALSVRSTANRITPSGPTWAPAWRRRKL